MALAADADAPEEEVRELAAKLSDARMLPFVMLSDADGNYLAGHSGLLNQPALLGLLAKA